jgi:hypothetical protein
MNAQLRQGESRNAIAAGLEPPTTSCVGRECIAPAHDEKRGPVTPWDDMRIRLAALRFHSLRMSRSESAQFAHSTRRITMIKLNNASRSPLKLAKETVKNMTVRSGVQAGGFSLNGKLSAESFCAGCQSHTVPAPV